MDVTVEVMLPPRGATDYSTSAHPKWRVLAIVAVYPMSVPASVNMPNTGYVHVTGVPERAGWAALTTEELFRRINTRLGRAWEDATGETVERRVWAGVASSMTANMRNTLLTERQITVTWTQFKSAMRHLIELRSLGDGDLD